VKTFFEAADALKYGGASEQPYDGPGEYARLEKLIATLQNGARDI